ncbi:MAG: roadblock/LC7 domain-containing protein [Planctomycetota bacterium]|nr:roadblock/LC7 domain-containing protein [Planctomycetota bacterium]
MRISDDELRQDRLVFYAQDVGRLDGELDGLLEFSGARCAILIDREGHLVTRRGDASCSSMEALSALVAGSFAATREVARLLGEDAFSTLFHQGAHQSIQVSTVGDRTLLAVVWDQRSNLGLVRFYAQETTKRLEQVFDEIAERPRDRSTEQSISVDYGDEEAAALDELF